MTAILDEKKTEVLSSEDIKEFCDGCGGTVHASYMAEKESDKLFFCGHHIRRYAENLKNQGFKISPENINYDAKTLPSLD